jgi:hypothetical protein
MAFPRSPQPYIGAPSPVLPAPMTSSPALVSADSNTPPVRGPPADPPDTLADDLLQGAEAIALFMFGTTNAIRSVYRLSSEVEPEHRPPFFKLGTSTLCARKSAILRWVAEKEHEHQHA